MFQSIPTVIVLLFAAVSLLGESQAQAEELSQDVKDAIESRITDDKLVGIVIGIVDGDNTNYHTFGRKRADEEGAPDENTVFEIGSITKVFTGILLADAVARGEVTFDDPIDKHLPDTVTVPTRNGTSITLENLSVQNSALPRLPNNLQIKNPANPYADYTNEQLYESLGSITLQRDIGEKYEYSNLGVGLLGHLLERATGKTYEELILERISEPLNLPDTRVTLTNDMTERLAPGHVGNRQVSNWDIATLSGAGALRSTAQDMVTFLSTNLGQIETPLSSAMEASHQPRAEAGSSNMHIGLGWHIMSTKGPGPIVWHNGGTGGYRSFAGFVKEIGKGVVVLTNSSGEDHDDIGFHLLDESIPLESTTESVAVNVDVEKLERYVGKYQLTPAFIIDVDLDGNQLRAQATGQQRFPIFPESETKFFYKVVDAQITFEIDNEGNVTGLTLHQGGQNMPAKRID